ncbi:Grap2 and cyclin-D-interacting-domain-containing protein [Geranomyces variabilis]|nr:Grap2 and cyclin-D-interacting-domain-containing protein [Geranomyces variabilis]KAJ3138071.1 Cyclin-D1-binding protein 1 [Geranomyces variabilis]
MAASLTPAPPQQQQQQQQQVSFDAELTVLIDLALRLVRELAQPTPTATNAADSSSSAAAAEPTDSSSSSPAPPYNPASFRAAIKNGANVLSHNATKLSLIAPEKSADTPKIIYEMRTAVLHITAVISSVPPHLGTSLQSEIRAKTTSLLYDVAALANRFMSVPRTLDTGVGGAAGVGYMSSTGLVWKACEVLEEMSMTNGEAAAKKVASRVELVQDAIDEVQQALEGAGGGADGHDGWGELVGDHDDADDDDDFGSAGEMTAVEKELATKCLTIMKAAKLLLRKTSRTLPTDANASSSSSSALASSVLARDVEEERGRMQDELARLADQTSRHVDDLVACIEPGIHVSELAEAAGLLAGTCSDVVSLAKALAQDDDEQAAKWLDMCGAQVTKVLEEILSRRTVR